MTPKHQPAWPPKLHQITKNLQHLKRQADAVGTPPNLWSHGPRRPKNFRQIKTHERSVSRWRLYHKIPKNPVKSDVCPYIATHLIADDQVQVPRSPRDRSSSLPRIPTDPSVRETSNPSQKNFSSNRRTPKIYVNSTPVPALVPSQCDGSGGPWQ